VTATVALGACAAASPRCDPWDVARDVDECSNEARCRTTQITRDTERGRAFARAPVEPARVAT